ncbi:MAG: hypothetical protein ABL998_04995 [Planctomycetota bacterium]
MVFLSLWLGLLSSSPLGGDASFKLSGVMPPGLVGQATQPLLSSDGAWVLYLGNFGQSLDLYSVPFAGGTSVRLNGTLVAGGAIQSTSISPDSSRVVYLADQDVNDKAELYSVPVAGGSVVKLNPALPANGDVLSSVIASDSGRVVFLLFNGTTAELYSVPLAGGAATKLNPPLAVSGFVTSFLVSPDATRVVYRADQEVDERFELYSVPIAGGSSTKLNGTLPANGDVPQYSNLATFSISADSSRVVYLADQVSDELYELFSVPIAGGSTTKLNPTPVTGGDVAAHAISPDSSSVVYIADQDTDFVSELYRVPLTGGAATKLSSFPLPNSDVLDFFISPDSSRVAYVANQDQDVVELFGVALAGGAVVKLNPPLTSGGDVTYSTFSQVGRPRISADSSRVVFLADADVAGQEELYSTPIAGGASVKLNPALQPTGYVSDFLLTPDATQVVLAAQAPVAVGQQLFGVPLAGGAAVALAPASTFATVVQSLQIAPDSSAVLYASDRDAPAVTQCYRSPLAGGSATRLNASLPLGFVSRDVTQFATSADGQRTVFVADREFDEVYELYSATTSGGPLRRLDDGMPGFGDVKSFRVTPDSSTVVYQADTEIDEVFQLFRVPVEGGTPVQLTPLAPLTTVKSFELSPDGTMIVYIAREPADPYSYLLYSLPLTGGVPIQLNQDLQAIPPQYVANFRISPDSSRVVFQDEYFNVLPAFTNPYGRLSSVSIFGGPVVQLSNALGYCLSYHIAPDSNRVLFTADQDVARQFELYSVPIAGGSTVKLNPQLGGGSVGVVSWCPFASCSGAPPTFTDAWARFSPDGARVVFTASESSSSARSLYSIPAAGGTATVLASSTSGIPDAFGISADSTRVVYLAPTVSGGNAAHSVPIAGGASTQLSGTLVSGGSVTAHVESPDSSTVVFVADKDTNDKFELYSVPLGGGAIVKLNSPLAAAGDVSGFGLAVASDSRSVVFLADADANGQQELFRGSLRGSAPARRLSGALVPGGHLIDWQLTSDARFLVYRADQDRDETFELYGSPLTRLPRRSGPP